MISKIEGEIMAEMEAPRVREQGEEEKRMKNDVLWARLWLEEQKALQLEVKVRNLDQNFDKAKELLERMTREKEENELSAYEKLAAGDKMGVRKRQRPGARSGGRQMMLKKERCWVRALIDRLR